MHLNYKKIFKIGGLILILLVVLSLAASFISTRTSGVSNTSMNMTFGGYGGKEMMEAAMDEGFGLGTAISKMADSMDVDQAAAPKKEDSGGVVNGEGDMTEKKIIKNGTLSLYVKDAEAAVKEIQSFAFGLGGFVSESNVSEKSDGSKSGSITIRIPASYFEQAMNNIKQIAVEVEREYVNSQDVTEEYVDLEAQIRNLRAEEKQYLEIMERSYTINDTLQVANRLSNVRGRIERIQGRMQYLSRQVDMSTIRITLSADDDISVFGIRWRPLVVAKRSIKNMLSSLADYVDRMIGFLFLLPVIIVWFVTIVFIFYVAWKILRWIYRRFFSNILKHTDSDDKK